MAAFVCRVQFLDDTDPFSGTSFPEPSRAPLFSFRWELPLLQQIAGVHRLLGAPQKLEDCALQLSLTGTYLDLDLSLAEQSEDLDGFQVDGGRGKKKALILRTQLSVRVHACIEKLYTSSGRELRRALFSLKQIFQDDKDLVHDFVLAEGLSCLIRVGTEADQNYQNYILRALGQVMLFVDGMNGVIRHPETLQWLYSLVASKFRLVVKMALKLLLVFVEYAEANAALLVQAVSSYDASRGCKLWSNAVEVLEEKEGVDTELLVFMVTLINKTLAGLPDQDSYYDMVDCLEEQGFEDVAQRYLNRKGTDLDLLEQFNIYETTLRHEDGDDETEPAATGRKDRRRASVGGVPERRGLERRRSRRHSFQNGKGHASAPASPSNHGHVSNLRMEDMNKRLNGYRLQTGRPHCTLYTVASAPPALHNPASTSSPSFPEATADQLPLGCLLASSFRQHQESLAAERQHWRVQRGERLDEVCRTEESGHVQKGSTLFKFKPLERKTPRNCGSGTPSAGRTEITLCLSPRSRRPLCPQVKTTPTNPHTADEKRLWSDLGREVPSTVCSSCSQQEKDEDGAPEPSTEDADRKEVEEESEGEALSEKERKNEEVKEKDNCSASSISSNSSTLERGEQDIKVHCQSSGSGQWENQQHSGDKEKEPEMGTVKRKELEPERGEMVCVRASIASPANQSSVLDTRNKVCENQVVRKEGRLEGLLWKKMVLQTNSESPLPGRTTPLPTLAPPTILKKESDQIWEQMMARPHQLHIRDMDFSDLVEEDDVDILEVVNEMGSPDLTPPPPPPPPPLSTSALPPPPPFLACPIPPPVPGTKLPHTPTPSNWAQSPHLQKKRKTIRLFWNEVRPGDWQLHGGRRCSESLWTKLEAVKVDTEKLENLFQTRSKDLNICKKTAVDGKRQEVIVLDSKRSNAINIGLTVLPPPRTIKTAILNFDEFTLNKEGIEKILSMIPTEEEKEKIQEAQLQNPDVPLGNAEQFLLTLSSISEISARLQLWAFRLDYDTMEKDIVEPLQDLKEGMEQLEKNVTLRYILSTLLAIGNFLNGSNAKGFELSYLEKVPEVKDTVHKQSLLHHACTIIVEKFPDGSDLYSEIGAITRSAKIDFDQLHENLCLMERRCKASWDHLKVISKHEMKIVMRQRMSDFLRDCTERIIILKTVHRRVINRFHAFLLFLGHPSYAVREVSIHRFCKMVSEFALEYRTARERVLQQKQKRANHRERNKTRGKMIIESGKFDVISDVEPGGLGYTEETAEHESMKAVLLGGGSVVPGLRTRTRARQGCTSVWSQTKDDSAVGKDATADEIMERIVRAATQGANQRMPPRERRRSRANRKSLRRSLRSTLTPDEAQALGLAGGSEVQV
ncbi:FH1/FH2 domain-containing protein 3 isoform X2 [Denticeps clupeoides]|uniref:FH1/FH2 domain-containing protein 3 isoform X2 n=1 Tax=Denticeps clupeoides TaxID=299321 RepID=UPI0010A3434A|nr:FH1/FH2 domain-containing protein 3-like isoform X2 [Denticeps clupeoides]